MGQLKSKGNFWENNTLFCIVLLAVFVLCVIACVLAAFCKTQIGETLATWLPLGTIVGSGIVLAIVFLADTLKR